MKCLAIGGLPASGKTTLMQLIYERLNTTALKFGLLRGHYDKNKNLALLGLYNNTDIFKGTDKLSMAVNPHFLIYAEKNNRNLLFEGDRLFTLKNLTHLNAIYKLRIIILNQTDIELKRRHNERNDNQSDKFIKGRATKIANIKKAFNNSIENHTLNSIEDSKVLANNIILWYEK